MEDKLDKLETDEGEDVEGHKLEPTLEPTLTETDEPEDEVEGHGPAFGPAFERDKPAI